MDVKAVKGDWKKISCDVVVVGLFQGEKNTTLKSVDKTLSLELTRLAKSKKFTGEFGELHAISTLGKMKAQTLLLAGLGKKNEYTLEHLRRIAALSLKHARSLGGKKVVSTLHSHEVKEKKDSKNRALAFTEGTLLGNYRFIQYKTQGKDKVRHVKEVVLVENKHLSDVQKGIKKGTILSQSTIHVRNMVNLPANIATPVFLAKEAVKLRKYGVKVKVYGEKDIKKLGFTSMLAVAGGSAKEPQFVVMEYGKKKGSQPYAFVGKGITFDAGGLSLKSSKGMEEMKMDMGGAASVIGLVEAVARLKLPVHILGAFPACENMPSGTSYRPGDIITTYNKKTIEMLNSDAEGRMILADGLAYVEKTYKPKVMVDFATLTGACVVALGYWATGMMSTNDSLCKEFIKAGEETYDRVWRLPLWQEYRDNMKSDIADVRNIGRGYDAGTIEAAVFLSHFVDKVPWVHLDIAGTAFRNAEKYYLPKGGTGSSVRLCVKWLENRVKK